MTRREAFNAITGGLVLGAIYSALGPLWTLYVAGVVAILCAAYTQSARLDDAQQRLAAYKERVKRTS